MIDPTHSYECALMSEYTYHFDDENAKIPDNWYIFRKLRREKFLDARLVVFEKIISLDDPTKLKLDSLPTEPHGVNKNKKILNLNVQQVYAFAGTDKFSWLNWIADFIIAIRGVPSNLLIGFMNGIPRDKIMEGPTKTQIYKLTDNGKDISKLIKLMCLKTVVIGTKIQYKPIYDSDLSDIEYPDYYKKLLEKYIEAGYSIRRKVHNFTYTGHSLGALCAVEIASYMGTVEKQNAQAIVFECPGAVMDNNQKKWANSTSSTSTTLLRYNVISYLAAPNLVNTCHEQVGKIIRLHIQHVPNGYRKWLETFTSIIEDITRSYIIRYLFSSRLPESQFEKNYFPLSIKNLMLVILLNCVVRSIWNICWTFNQHNMKNLLNAFEINGLTMKYGFKNIPGTDNGKEMSNWPTRSQYQLGDRLRRVGFFISPAPKLLYFPFANSGIISSLLGIEENVSEAQSQHTIGYRK